MCGRYGSRTNRISSAERATLFDNYAQFRRVPPYLRRITFVNRADVCDSSAEISAVLIEVIGFHGSDSQPKDCSTQITHLFVGYSNHEPTEPCASEVFLIFRSENLPLLRRHLEAVRRER